MRIGHMCATNDHHRCTGLDERGNSCCACSCHDYITLSFTPQEIDVLDAAFEVLTEGEGIYMRLNTPYMNALHSSLFQKFRKARLG